MAAFVHRLRVRYGECDPQGWVFNAHYLAYFDVALTELWREAIGPYGEMVEQGVDMVVAESQLRYLAPAHFDQELEIALEIEGLGTTSMTTDVTMCAGSTEVVRGQVRHVFIAVEGAEKGEKVEIPYGYGAGWSPTSGPRPSRTPSRPPKPRDCRRAVRLVRESVGPDDGFRAAEPAGERVAAFCRLEHVVPWVISGAHWSAGRRRAGAATARPRALRAVRRADRRRPRAARAPPRRAPHRRRLLRDGPPDGVGQARRPLG